MPNINSMPCKVAGAIHLRGLSYDEVPSYVEALRNMLNSNDRVGQWAFVLHNQDLKPDGTPETPHFQIYFQSRKKTRISTHINSIAKALLINGLAVSLSPCSNEVKYIQYLIHKNEKDPNQFHYSKDDIYTNIPEEELDLILEQSNDDPFDFHSLKLLVLQEKGDNIAIMEAIGVSSYQRYRLAIRDLIDAYWHGRIDKEVKEVSPSV